MKPKDQNLKKETVAQGICVSVIIPAYKAVAYINEALESVFGQTYKNIEVIVVNDGSPDTNELEAVLKPYLARIKYVRQKNSGAAVARNRAIEEASGEILAFLDHDDIWFPEYLETQIRIRDEKNADLLYCDAILFGDGLKKKQKYSLNAPSSGRVNTYSLIDASCNVITSGTIVSRQSVVDHGCFDENLPGEGFEDFDLWFRLAKQGVVLDFHESVLLKYRVHSDNLSGNAVKIAERDVIALDVLEQKYNLTDEEKKILSARRQLASAGLDLERAKAFLAEDKFDVSIEHFIKAQNYFQTMKLRFVIAFLSFNPKLAQRFFKTIRG